MHAKRVDRFVVGALAGIIASLVRFILGYSIIFFLIPDFLNCTRIAAGIILPPAQVMAGGFWVTAVGLQIDLVVSIVVGLIATFILEYTGAGYYLFKGAVIGATTWSVFYAVLSRFLSQLYPVDSIVAAELSFLIHVIYGIALVSIIARFKKD